nr:MAG TPA: hypothetical protein [Caudoviricetes sp.]
MSVRFLYLAIIILKNFPYVKENMLIGQVDSLVMSL